jgi:hypothetical protein
MVSLRLSRIHGGILPRPQYRIMSRGVSGCSAEALAPAEFLACLLSNGKGFYSTLAYTLECRRLGISLLPPDVNASRWNFTPEAGTIGVPLRAIKDLTTTTLERYRRDWERRAFESLRDFYDRVNPTAAEFLNLIVSVHSTDSESRGLHSSGNCNTSLSGPRPNGHLFQSDKHSPLPTISLTEPDHTQRVRDETEFLGFTVSGHPLDQFSGIPWETYCPLRDFANYAGQRITPFVFPDRLDTSVDAYIATRAHCHAPMCCEGFPLARQSQDSKSGIRFRAHADVATWAHRHSPQSR